MTARVVAPDVAGVVAGLERRVGDLERILRRFLDERKFEQWWGTGGPVGVETGSPWRPPNQPISFHSVILELEVAGSTDTVVNLMVNDTIFDSYTIDAGSTSVEYPVTLRTTSSDRIWPDTVTAGTDAEGLSFGLRE